MSESDNQTVENIIQQANQHYAFTEWKEAYLLYKKIEHLTFTGHVNYRLGVMYDNGYFIQRDKEISDAYFRKAYLQLKESIKRGDVEATCDLGYMYDCGCYVPKDEKKAYKFYKKAANKGLQRAQFNLGLLYDQGVGVEKDIEMSLSYFRRAAEQGYVNALCHLGYLHRIGFSVGNIVADEPLAFKFYKQAADAGYHLAILDVGNFYMRGMGVPVNYKEATRYYEKIIYRNEEARLNILKLLYSCDDHQRLGVKLYLSEEWPNTHAYLHNKCQLAILELYYLVSFLDILPELRELIVHYVILFWTDKELHFNHYLKHISEEHKKEMKE